MKIKNTDSSWTTTRLHLPMGDREANQLIKSECPKCKGYAEANPEIENAILNSGKSRVSCYVYFTCYNLLAENMICEYSWHEPVVFRLTVEKP